MAFRNQTQERCHAGLSHVQGQHSEVSEEFGIDLCCQTPSVQEPKDETNKKGSTKMNKLSVGWKLPNEGSMEDGQHAPVGSFQSLRKVSSAALKGGVRFTPSVQIIEHEDDIFTLDEMDVTPSFEALKRRRMTAFHSQLEDFKKVEIAKSSVRRVLGRLSSLLCVLSMIIGIFTILDLEMSYKCGISFRTGEIANRTCSNILEIRSPIFFKSLISLCSGGMCIGLFVHYHYQCRYLIVVHQLPVNATVLNSPLCNSFLAEFLLCALHIPPYLDKFIPTELQLVALIRLYLTGRYMKEHNATMRSRSTRFLASVLKIELTSSYLIKTFFLKNPLFMIVLCYLLNLFGSGYLVFAMDRYSSPLHHNTFVDTVWMQAVTMTTLGFGDVTPDSLLGRAVVALSAVCGIFLMALLISVIHETLQLTQQEKRILAYVERIDYSKRYKDMAARCIQATWRLYRWHRNGQAPLTKMQSCLVTLGLVHPKRLLTNQLYNALFYWREIKKSRTPDDLWVKDFVADNTALMLTDVLRKMDNIEDMLTDPASDGKEDEGEDEHEETIHVITADEEPAKKTQAAPHYCTKGPPSSHRMSTAWTCPKHKPHGHVDSHPVIHVQESTKSSRKPSAKEGVASHATSSEVGDVVLRRITEAELKVDNMYHAIRKELSDLKTLIKKGDCTCDDDG